QPADARTATHLLALQKRQGVAVEFLHARCRTTDRAGAMRSQVFPRLSNADKPEPGSQRRRVGSWFQCRKWRTPVKIIAISRSSAAAITSSSRTDPPG